ncbi:diacylglycerol kinase family protein [Limosilactobacillus difficilis]|uniref:diacylglycerol kinase family protein n=1 Tax=Limosilactobacillus difficilis TaxID=2991838 RepID=UPI0024B8C027|nr:diacylglycerol kinase family protein [Limosilactobacillus difficilis]
MALKDKRQTAKNRHLGQAVGHALQGIEDVITSERNMRFHLTSAVLVVLAGGLLKVSCLDWLWLVTAIVAVLAAEMLNTITEWLCDLVVGSRFDPLVKKIKDAAAGMVILVAFLALIIGLIIFVPALLKFLKEF